MSYIALYRKWRPTSFDDVKGQDAVVKTLRNQIISGRIGHAYLFCGSRGTGKTSVAKIFAKVINCENPKDGCACGVCRSCLNIESGASTNVVEIDAASNNGVDNIREIRDEVAYRPAEGKYKVYIIDEAHMLTASAFNALLKTLEEPPEYVVFIFATTEAHSIPATVQSRCQRYDFHRITTQDIVGRLKELAEGEQIRAQESALRYIARKADGALRDAISLFDQSVSAMPGEELRYEDALRALGTVDSETLSRTLRAILEADTNKALSVLDEIRSLGREMGQFVQDLIAYLRNLLLLMTADAPAELLEMSEEDWLRLKDEALMTSPEELMALIRLFSQLLRDMRGASDKRILLEVAMIQATRPLTQEDNEAILARLGSLERKIEKWRHAPAGTQTAGEKAAPEPADPPEEEKPVVKLSPAKWEDLQLLKNNWKEMMRKLPHPSEQLLREVWIDPQDGGVMRMVFPDTFAANLVKRFGTLEQLGALVEQEYGKTMRFDVSVRGKKEIEPVYISDLELSRINMPVEIIAED